jgi:hypothetical protein
LNSNPLAGVDAGLTKVAGHVALNLFFPPPLSDDAGTPLASRAPLAAQATRAAADVRAAAGQAGQWAATNSSKAGAWATGVWDKARTASQAGSLTGGKPKAANAENWRAVLSHAMASRTQPPDAEHESTRL